MKLGEKISQKAGKSWECFRRHFTTLPSRAQKKAAYEAARLGESRGTSGFHGFGTSVPYPFRVCGWAKTNIEDGVAFQIEAGCFSSKTPLLYYWDDDGWPCYKEDWLSYKKEEAIAEILRCSSGITDVRVETRTVDFKQKKRERQCVLFRLDRKKIKKTVMLDDEVETKKLGGYVFVLPRCGEFNCVLGEIVDDEMIPLHYDDFCMK